MTRDHAARRDFYLGLLQNGVWTHAVEWHDGGKPYIYVYPPYGEHLPRS